MLTATSSRSGPGGARPRAVRFAGTGITVGTAGPPGAGVRVRVTSAGICGSDLHALAADAISAVPGHEFGGFLDSGGLVAVRPFVACGSCEQCRDPAEHLCAVGQARFHGATVDGGLADEVWVDERSLVHLAPGVDAGHVALVEPIAVAVHAVNRAGVRTGERALVVGGGTIGLLCGAVLRDRGVEVTIAARHPAQLRAADALGLRTEPSGRCPVVIDAAGSTSSFAQCVSSVRRGGRVVLVALPWEPLAIGFGMVFKEVDVRPSIYYTHDEFEQAARFLERHPTLAGAIVTHRFGLDGTAEAFRVAGDRGAGAIKVLLIPPQSAPG